MGSTFKKGSETDPKFIQECYEDKFSKLLGKKVALFPLSEYENALTALLDSEVDAFKLFYKLTKAYKNEKLDMDVVYSENLESWTLSQHFEANITGVSVN